MNLNNEIQTQLDGAKNIFFGVIKGIDSIMNIKTPYYVYHYTSIEKFMSMVESNTVRLYTVSNCEDELERKITLKIEEKIKAEISDKNTGESHNFSETINKALSEDHVFTLSTAKTDNNNYLWKNYGDSGRGVCLKFSVNHYFAHIESNLPEFDLLPNYLKCCYISYDNEWIDAFMEVVFSVIQDRNESLGRAGHVVYFFFLEYWRSFLKTTPYSNEEEVRLVVSDNYSVFLFVCGLLAKCDQSTVIRTKS